MDIKKIITSIVVLLLVVGIGLGAYYILNLGGAATQPTNTTVDNGGGTVNVPTIPTHTSNVAGNPDVESAFATLFTLVGAQKVSLTAVTSSDGDLGSVYSLYSSDIAIAQKNFPKLTEFPISIALVDLNKDGTPEAVVWENLPGLCGSAGCPLEIYKKIKGKWTMFYSGMSGSTIGISSSYSSGYANLLLPSLGNLGYQSDIVLYVYNGIQYVPNKIVATWDGNQFLQ